METGGGAERLKDLGDVIDRHGEAIGRDTSAIERTVLIPLCYRASKEREDFVTGIVASMNQIPPAQARKQAMIGTAEECFEAIERYREAGVTHFIFMTFTPYNLDEIQAFAEEIIPKARRFGTP